MWVWGHDDLDEFLAYPDGVNLDDVIEKISVPILITHGENDRQIPPALVQPLEGSAECLRDHLRRTPVRRTKVATVKQLHR